MTSSWPIAIWCIVWLLPAVCSCSWVKPGKVAWDWWNDWNIYDVDFRAGINTETYKYYIDFAAEHGIEYVILDEGWSVNMAADLMQVIPEIDIPELVNYGKSKKLSESSSGRATMHSTGIWKRW